MPAAPCSTRAHRHYSPIFWDLPTWEIHHHLVCQTNGHPCCLVSYPWHSKYYSSPPGTSPLMIERSLVLSCNLYHLTSGLYLCFSISSVHSDYDMLCSTLVLVPLCRYLHAVCTALAFIPPVCSSGYCTFCSLTYSSAPPPLLMLCFSVVYKLLDTPLYSSLNIN